MNFLKIYFPLTPALMASSLIALIPSAIAQVQPAPSNAVQPAPAQKPPEKTTPAETGGNKPAVKPPPKRPLDSGSICKVDPDLCPKGKPLPKEPGKAAP